MEILFNKDAPFFDSYEKQYEEALRTCNVTILNMHEEAIYWIDNGIQAFRVVTKLIQIAVSYPDQDFVETLIFYLSKDIYRKKYIDYFERQDNSEKRDIIVKIQELEEKLRVIADDDLANTLRELAVELSAVM